MRGSLLLAATLALMPPAGIGAAQREYRIEPPPDWIAPVAAPTQTAPAGEVTAGAFWRIVDRQVRVDGSSREAYYRYAIELLNEHGVDENAQLTFDFDPSYQSLILHNVSIRRGARRIDGLREARASVLQRETDLEDRLYDGTRTLSLVLADVRVGDVLDYSFSLRGHNPVFGTRFYDSYSARWSEPIAFMRLRVLHPRDKPIRYKTHGGAPAPRVREIGAARELLWEEQDVPGLINESGRPAWHVLYPYIQFSEAASWSEVGSWAHSLFNAHRPSGAQLLAQARLDKGRELAAGERVLAALRFVQQEIRYTGIEIGRGSHEPTDPAVVLGRRFGDCKDKSLLLVHLLRALEIPADAVLVDNSRGQTIDALLPSPLAFNHTIVRARVEGRDYWLDPTLATQSGGLRQVHQPDYGFALAVAADSKELERMPPASSALRTQEVLDVFDLSRGISAPGKLTVTSAYLARDADRMRTRFASSSRARIEKEYVNYYARSYPVEVAGPIEVQDDPAANRFRVIERYRLKTSFQDADEGGKELNVRGYALDDYIRKPDTPMRQSPLAIAHPVNLRHAIEVRLPEAWDIEDESGEVRDSAFEFRFRRSYDRKDEVLKLEYVYRSLSDHVAPEALAAYLANLDKVDEEYGYWLSYDPDAAASSGYVPAFYGVGLLSLVAGVWLARLMYRYSPPPLPRAGDFPGGIRGWLVLPAIGCFAGPIVSAYLTWSLSLHFAPHVWAVTETVLAPWTRSFAHPYICGLFALAILLTCADFMLVALFVRKRTSVPRLFPLLLWASAALGALVVFGMDPEKSDQPIAKSLAETARDIVSAFIWTLYFWQSRRVRATFRNQHPAAETRVSPFAIPPDAAGTAA